MINLLKKEAVMIQFNMFEAQTNLSKIAKMLESGEEDYIIVTRNGEPLLRIILEPKVDVSKRLGIAKGKVNIPDDFDDIDIFEDF